jgi:hypothetical protein
MKTSRDVPIYIVSKGRADTHLTARALDRMGTPYYIVVEEQEREEYAAVIDPAKILVLDRRYQDEYDTCDDLGTEKSKGPGPARNFAWEHAIASGAKWHWVMDDNISMFARLNDNLKVPVADDTILRCMESFVARYRNVVMAGPNYWMFAPRKQKIPKPFVTNTRIYSCNLIRNDIPFRWRGRYNEDTDLSLRILKSGWCTIQFNAFLQFKNATQTMKGGNTEAFYAHEGTRPKSQMLVDLHPDVTKPVIRFGRDHHLVDYRRFQRNRLLLRTDIEIARGVDDWGMELVQKSVVEV